MKNFKTVKQSPLGQTNTFEESNVTQIKLPRGSQPFDYFLGEVVSLITPIVVNPGQKIIFNVTDEKSKASFISISQDRTEFSLSPGYIYKLTSQIHLDITSGHFEFGWFKSSDVTAGVAPDTSKVIGRAGYQNGSKKTLIHAIGFLDLCNSTTVEKVVTACISGQSGTKDQTHSIVEVELISNKSGPWN